MVPSPAKRHIWQQFKKPISFNNKIENASELRLVSQLFEALPAGALVRYEQSLKNPHTPPGQCLPCQIAQCH